MMRAVEIGRRRNREEEAVMLGTDKAIAIVYGISFVSFFVIASGCLMYISPMLKKRYSLGWESLSDREKDGLEYFGLFSILFYIFSVGAAYIEIYFIRRFRIFNQFSVWISRYWHGHPQDYQPLPQYID